jgi:FkbM family methyltransferase
MIHSLLYKLNHLAIWQQKLNVWGHCLKAASLDRLVFLILHRLGFMGAQEMRLLHKLIKPGMTIIDVGANIGLYSLLLVRLTGKSGKVYSFEPESTLFSIFLENCKQNNAQNIVAHSYAAGNANGRAAFNRSSLNSGNNSLSFQNAGLMEVEVEIVKVDDLLPDKPVDFIKIDVQGHEYGALAGMERILTSNPEIKILFEFWPAGLKAAETKPEDLISFLQDRGFSIHTTEDGALTELSDPKQLIDDLGRTGYTNLLAQRSTRT